MDKNLKKFMATETRSRAQILDRHFVEVQTPDGELFKSCQTLPSTTAMNTRPMSST